jgi:ATP-dependent protease ClpP protease subunit
MSKDQVLYDAHNHGVNLNLRDIYLHSYYQKEDIEEEPGVDYRQATTFIKNLHVLDNPPHKPILVHLHSIGGDWNNGMAIFNAVQFATSYVTMLAYSQASSMSGIIFQAPEFRCMMPDCHFLMHHGDSGTDGHPFAIKTAADFEMKACKRMLEIFSERAWDTGPFFKKKKSSTVQTAYNFFDKKVKEKVDWFLSSEEALFYGLTDAILGCNKYPDLPA